MLAAYPVTFGTPELGIFLLANVVILLIVGPKLVKEFGGAGKSRNPTPPAV